MRRRSLLAASGTALVGLAGCLGRTPETGRTPSPTESPSSTPTETPSPGCPEKPAPLTAENVGPFVKRFERAWVERVARANDPSVVNVRYDFGLGVADVAMVGEGYHVALDGGYAVFERSNGATAHGDVFDYRARYFLTADEMRRTAGYDDPPDPRTEGRPVTCPPSNPPDELP